MKCEIGVVVVVVVWGVVVVKCEVVDVWRVVK